MRQINWGMIGCGGVTEAKSGPAFNRVNGSRLLAVASRSPEKARDYCRRHRIPHVNALLCPKLLHYAGWLRDDREVGDLQARIAAMGRYTADIVAWAEACNAADLEWLIAEGR